MPISWNVGTSGSCPARLRPETASARNLPALMLPMAPPSVVIHTAVRPEMKSVTAWLYWLYGTCWSRIAARSLNSVVARWPLEPVPSDA